MKKVVMYGLMTSLAVFSTAAYANDPDPKEGVLTTQRYVDDGLEFVYKVATGASNGAVQTLQTDVANIQTALDDGNDGLINVGDLKDDVDDVKGALSDGNGGYIDVSDLQDTVGNTDLTGIGDGTVTGAISDLDTAINGNGGLDDRVESLEDTVGDTDLTGIGNGTVTGAISELNTAVSNLNQNSSIDGANTGVRISNKKIQLDVPAASANDGKSYVYQNGAWTALETVTQWNPSFLTGGN